MSNKGKNSNYKNNIGEAAVATKKKGLSKDQKKDIIIWGSFVAVMLGIIIAVIICSIPKTTYVEMDFGDYGKIVIQLDEDEAPITVKNFVGLVKSGFYDGLTIFRAQNNFVIQGGKDDTVNLPTIKGEFNSNGVSNNISHVRGVISMARTNAPDSATSQFFITLADSAAYSLDGSYAGFGYVVEGMDVVDKIAEDLMKCPSDSMGFVSDEDAIKIVSAKVIKYKGK